MITLRPYQRQAVNAVYKYWEDGVGDHPLLVAPTGAGKTAMLAKIVTDAARYGSRVLILTHVSELIQQGAAALQSMMPGLDIGIYSASLRQKNLRAQVIYGQIQSIHQRAYQIVPTPELIIIDEAHLVPPKTSTRYGSFLDDMRRANPSVKILGLTATPYRLDSGWLHHGEGALFDGIAYQISVPKLIEDGYLSPVVARAVGRSIDLSNVRKRGGEYLESDLAIAASDPELVRATAAEIVEKGADRKSWLAFACGVNHANMLADAISNHGIWCEVLTGETSKAERAEMIDRYKSGRMRCLINIGVLTTGFDAPNTDLVAIVRATESAALYVQIVGRGMRIAEGKNDCLILDYGSNVERHGLIDQIRPRRPGSGKGEPPAKSCPECDVFMPTAVRICPNCGYEYPPPKFTHDHKSYSGAMISTQLEAEWVDVSHVGYARHRKEGKPDSIRVQYQCGLLSIREWLCPDHGGGASAIYRKRLWKLGGKALTTDEALQECRHWRMPKRIKIVPDGKYHKVLDVET